MESPNVGSPLPSWLADVICMYSPVSLMLCQPSTQGTVSRGLALDDLYMGSALGLGMRLIYGYINQVPI